MKHPTRASILYAVGWFLLSFAIWLWLVDSTVLAELLIGLGVAALATVLALLERHYSLTRFYLNVRWVRFLKGIPLGVLRDTGIVMLALWRCLVLRERSRSAFRLVPFSGVGDDPASVSWRAFAIAATSITPNTFVIGVDCERKTILVHQLVPESMEQLRRGVIGADPA